MDLKDWSSPFDPSILGICDVLIMLPRNSLCRELKEILENYGVKWSSEKLPTQHNGEEDKYEGELSYHIRKELTMRYCSKSYFDSKDRFEGYARYTYYGIANNDDDSDMGKETDEELMKLFA